MKKGSRAIRCYECNKIIGWEIPVGKTYNGIKEVCYKFHDCANIVTTGMAQFHYCDNCVANIPFKYFNIEKRKQVGRL